MRRLIKIIIILILLPLVALVAIPFVVPVETLKEQAVAQLEKATGRKVSMGNVSLKVFPNIALSADDVTIGNPAWLKDSGAMMEVKNLRIGVELMPLLSKDIHVTDLSLESPKIHLVKQGEKANWQFAAVPVAAAQTEETKAKTEVTEKSGGTPPLRLDSLSISNGMFVYEDSVSGTKQSAADVNVKLASKDLPKSITFTGDAVYNGSKASVAMTLGNPLGLSQGTSSDIALKATAYGIAVDWAGTVALKGGKPTMTGIVKIPLLDTTAMGTKSAAASAGKDDAPAASAERWSSAPISMQPLNSANADVRVEIGKLVLSKMTLENVKSHVKLNNGSLNADVEELKLFSGAVKLAVSAQAAGAAGIKASMTNVRTEELLNTLADSNVLSGALNGDVDFSMHGNSQRAMISSLAGNGQFKLDDGTYHGGNLVDMTRNVATSFQRGTNAAGKTDFKELSGTFTAKDGVFFNEDLKMNGTLLSLTGKGQIDLPLWQVHYLLTPVVITNRGSETASAAGISVPVKVEGSLDSPSYHPDLRATIQEGLKDPEKLKENLKNVKENIKDIKNLNKESLQNLLR